MKTTNTLFILFLSLFFSNALIAQTVELYPFGDMDQWVVREIKESGIIGGNTVTIYAIGPTDTIRENKPYVYGKKGCPWTVSNAYAVVAGVKKGSCSCYSHIAKPPFLLETQFFPFFYGFGRRKYAFGKTKNEHSRELQSLRSMNGHQLNCILLSITTFPGL